MLERNTASKRVADALMLELKTYHGYRYRYYSFWVMTELIQHDLVSPSEEDAIIELIVSLMDNPNNFLGLNVLFSRSSHKLFVNIRGVVRQISRLNTIIPIRFVTNGQYKE